MQNHIPMSSGGTNLNLFDERSGPFNNNLNNEIEMDSADNISNSHINHSTLSPQRLHSIREEVVGNGRQRVLESQPGGQSLGEPLYFEGQKRQRGALGRPFTNSPFPYMQKRSAKTKF